MGSPGTAGSPFDRWSAYPPPVVDGAGAQWVTLRAVVPRDDADLVAGLLWEAGVAGIEERAPGSAASDMVELLAGVPAAGSATTAAALRDRWSVAVEPVDEDDWMDRWQQWARPWRAGGRLVVVPAWQDPPDWIGPDDTPIFLDPGRAFGSGAHATTRLVLAELEARVGPGDTVLDVGCGSGVLAVAAARLGSGRVDAIDIDLEAVRATTANAARNGVSTEVQASLTPLDEVVGCFPIVVSNIGVGTLVALAPELVAHTEPGGTLVLSGLLAGQVEAVTEAVGVAGAVPVGTGADGDWRVLVLRRRV